MSPTLPPSLIAKLSPTCRWRGCSADKADGAEHCPEHRDKQLGYQRASMQRARDARRAARLCIDGCGTVLARTWRSDRCRQCQRAQTRRVKNAVRRVKDARRDLPSPARGHFKTEVFADGASRQRYVGQAHRGGPTKIEQRASAAKLVSNVVAHGRVWLDERVEKQAEIDELPRIQRAAASEAHGAELAYMGRLLIQAGAESGSTSAREQLRKLESDGDDEP